MGNCRGFITSIVLAGLMMTGAAARVPTAPPANPYTLSVSALVGPTGTDVTVLISAAAGSTLPTVAKKLSLTAPGWSKSVSNAALTGGQWTAHYTDLPRGKALTAHVEFKTTKTWNLCANTVALYRPDLGFASVGAPPSAHPNEVLSVPVIIEELKGDLGASFSLSVTGPGIQPVTATAVRVNPHGSTQLLLNVQLLAVSGPQTVTLSITGQIPGDYDPSNNTTSFVVQVSPLLASTQYYGGYFRSQGTTSETNTTPGGGSPYTGSSTGRNESLYIVTTSNQPMSWPMSGSMKMYADGAQAYSVDVTGVYPTTPDNGDGSSTYFQLFAPNYDYYIWIVLFPSGSTPAIRFNASKDATDYLQTITQNGITTTSVQHSGTFLNAIVSSEMTCVLSSALGQIGGSTGVHPILQSRRDEEITEPFIRSDHRDVWDSYSSGDLH